ncbi:MAG TPA: hypothetical protein VF331_19955 [Polyangiales bacterium]
MNYPVEPLAHLGQAGPAWRTFLLERVWPNFFAGAFPQQPGCIAVFTAAFVLGVYALLRPRARLRHEQPACATARRVLGAAMLVCLAQAFVLAALKLYPLGGYRLDLYLHPVHLLFVVAGVDWALQPVPAPPRAALAGVLALGTLGFLPGFAAPVQTYHSDKPASRYIAEMEREKRDGDVVFVYPKDFYTFALYTHWHVDVGTDLTRTEYRITSREPYVYVLPFDVRVGMWKALDLKLGRAPARIFYFAVHRNRGVDRRIVNTILKAGYCIARRQEQDGARLLLFVRARGVAPVATP